MKTTVSFSNLLEPKACCILLLLSGLMLPLGFAPFHITPCLFVSLALFYWILLGSKQSSFGLGFLYGLCFFGLSMNWLYRALHTLFETVTVALFLTMLLIMYLSLFTALVSLFFNLLKKNLHQILLPILFASLWTVSEMIRSCFMGGFPWMLLGYAQVDTLLALTIPYIGIYGAGFLACIISASIAQLNTLTLKFCFLMLICIPGVILNSSVPEELALSVAVIQPNQSTENKWDQESFVTTLKNIEAKIDQSLGRDLIVLPETAISVAVQYLHPYIKKLEAKAIAHHSALLLGIPVATKNSKNTSYANALYAVGKATGQHLKHHLVLFGEYIPQYLTRFTQWFPLSTADFFPGGVQQKLVRAHQIPFVSLICFELAFEDMIRSQLPEGQWIVSISDDALFGKTIQPYQQLQIAQARSLQTGRYQIVANNSGLSSVITPHGQIVSSLPHDTEGVLNASIEPIKSSTFWVTWGNTPVYCILIVFFAWVVFRTLNSNGYISNSGSFSVVSAWSFLGGGFKNRSKGIVAITNHIIKRKSCK
ncbi:apolipoprotein N-acyltransferase [Legionella shakespearei DSM 23087]|uniref:Apolipoprotein N-acyltransferase n=1 Tax=Legionella shakespearei DSM 23087 TaxID=1122169 RepID=A0A0W0YT23_9GAMM|nr:apolipoprotein N-acyltransferase [Legionella shakespearei DSM 23087]